MSSTEKTGPARSAAEAREAREEKLRSFFREHLAPAGTALRERGVELFPMGPDASAESWWEPAPEGPEFVELGPGEIAPALAERWRAQGLPELAALAESLMALADELEVEEEPSGEVSPFVYVMY